MPQASYRLPIVQSKNVGCRRCDTDEKTSRSPGVAVHPSISLPRIDIVGAAVTATSIPVLSFDFCSFQILRGPLLNGGVGASYGGPWCSARNKTFLSLHFSMDNIST